MKIKTLYQFSFFLFCLLLFSFRTAAQVAASTPDNVAPKMILNEDKLIHYGDLIDVDIVGSLEYDWRGTLNPEGFLDGLDFVETPVYALCKNEDEIASEIAKAYEKILREPKVVVKIYDRSNRPLVLLYGAVKTPQKFQLKRAVNLNELLILGGGLTDKSSGEVQIFRPQKLNCLNAVEKNDEGEQRERFVNVGQNNGSSNINIKISDLLSGDKDFNPQILSGDIVTVLEAQPIYVIGGVGNPKQIALRGQMTLTRAVDSAGGLTKNADANKITIFRRSGGETKTIEADLDKIKSGASEDVILQPFDVVEVAESGAAKRKYPPILKVFETNNKGLLNLPLRIVD